MFGRFFDKVSAIGDAIVDILEPSKPTKPKRKSSKSPLTAAKRRRTFVRKREIRNSMLQYQAALSAQFEERLSRDPLIGKVTISSTKSGLNIQLDDIGSAAQVLQAAKAELSGRDDGRGAETLAALKLEFSGTEDKVTSISRRANDEYDITACLDDRIHYDEAQDPFLKELAACCRDNCVQAR